MLTSISTIIILIVTFLLVSFLLIHLLNHNQSKMSQAHKIFILMCLLMQFWLIAIILQAVFSKSYNISPIYFDYFAYIGICFLPLLFYILSVSFSNTKFSFTRRYKLLFVIPVVSLLVLWTNNLHHLFYIKYSTNIGEAEFGPYFTVHSIYSYLWLAIGLIKLLVYTIKNSGFFSRQSIYIFLGVLIPVIINILGTFGIINMSIYITPISFAIAIFFFALSILKFDFLKVAPIALQRIVDRISDSYIVVNEHNIVTDFNETFLNLFNLNAYDIRNKSLESLFKKFNKTYGIKEDLILRIC